MVKKITNLVLANKIDNMKEYLTERCDKQDIIIEQNRVQGNKNTVAIASIKGMAVGVSAIVTLVLNGIWAFLSTRGKGMSQTIGFKSTFAKDDIITVAINPDVGAGTDTVDLGGGTKDISFVQIYLSEKD